VFCEFDEEIVAEGLANRYEKFDVDVIDIQKYNSNWGENNLCCAQTIWWKVVGGRVPHGLAFQDENPILL
jgi:hypothetical protein